MGEFHSVKRTVSVLKKKEIKKKTGVLSVHKFIIFISQLFHLCINEEWFGSSSSIYKTPVGPDRM